MMGAPDCFVRFALNGKAAYGPSLIRFALNGRVAYPPAMIILCVKKVTPITKPQSDNSGASLR